MESFLNVLHTSLLFKQDITLMSDFLPVAEPASPQSLSGPRSSFQAQWAHWRLSTPYWPTEYATYSNTQWSKTVLLFDFISFLRFIFFSQLTITSC